LTMTERKYNIPVILAAIIVPVVLLVFGIYGTFSFTFSIPIIWQIGFRGGGISSLGLKRKSLWPAVAAGILSGSVIAFTGGYILKALGIAGYSINSVEAINGFLDFLNIKIVFKGEMGCRLLAQDSTLKGILSYLGYSFFMVGLGEEIFWRGFIQKKMRNVLPKHFAIWVTAILFGLVHSYLFFVLPFKEGSIMVGLIALAGAFWGYLYERFDNIWAPALSHGVTAFVVWKYFVFLT